MSKAGRPKHDPRDAGVVSGAIMRILVVCFCFCLLFASVAIAQPMPGPFGFERGMTRAQIIALVGESQIKPNNDPHILVMTSAPKPNRQFETYALFIAPKEGLLKVMAVGVSIQSGDSGFDVRQAYAGIVNGISQKYGAPAERFDRCFGNEVECDSPEYWMLSLVQKNRSVMSFWGPGEYENGVTAIMVEIVPLTTHYAYITVHFEFKGFEAFADARETDQNKSY